MSEPIVAREVAEITVQDWEENFGIPLDFASRETVLRAVSAGRLTLDGKAEEFSYKLAHPISLDNGSTISELKLHEPNTGQMRDAYKGKREDFDVSVRLIGFITGCAVMDRIGQKDLNAMAALLGFFG